MKVDSANLHYSNVQPRITDSHPTPLVAQPIVEKAIDC